jgi:predicted alpha/beta-fold hydrolase
MNHDDRDCKEYKDYKKPPWPLRSADLHTLVAAVFRRPPEPVRSSPERIRTPDGDFLDLDWYRVGSPTLVILSHGLEGHARRPYMLGMARAANLIGLDALAWSYRGCSGVPNALPRLYHNGSIDDLDLVVHHALLNRYQRVYLVGFSMGGNMTMLYLGRCHQHIPQQVSGFVAISAPCDLTDCIRTFERPQGLLYTHYFLRTLKQKVRRKALQFPALFSTAPLATMRSLREFDDAYTAPLHGFLDAEDYWRRCSSRPHIADIRVPGLLLNSLDDPFLEGGCYPREEIEASGAVTLVAPRFGGHLGFVDRGAYWSEQVVTRFLQQREHEIGSVL